jgi:hypothetical protein
MVIIRGNRVPAVAARAHGDPVVSDPLGDQAVLVFAADLAAERVPSIRAIGAQLRVGQPRAQRLRDYLAAGAVRRTEIRLRNQLAVRARQASAGRGRLVADLLVNVVDADRVHVRKAAGHLGFPDGPTAGKPRPSRLGRRQC